MRETVKDIVSRLTPKLGQREARAVTELLFHRYKGWGRTDMLIHDDEVLSPLVRGELDAAVEKILAGWPPQYVAGEAYFYGMWFHVDPRVLIPRPETAEMVDMIVDRYGSREDLKVLDIATGSGCIAIALSRNLKFPEVTGIDLSADALSVARLNARNLHANVKFELGDIFTLSPQPESLDIMVSNPPYVLLSERTDMESSVKDFEPSMALFVPDDDPLKFYKPIAAAANRGLKPGGMLYLEINPLCADDMAHLLKVSGLTDVQITLDIHGCKRFAIAAKP